ncbi:MAG: hypothetical protein AAGJ57_12710, partial [Pseudomonadota bacterium]
EFVGRFVPDATREGNGWKWEDGPVVKAMIEGYWLILDELNLADACLAVLDFEAASDAVWPTPSRVTLAALRLAISAMACYAVDVCAGREQLAAEGLALLQGEDFIAVVVSSVFTKSITLSPS